MTLAQESNVNPDCDPCKKRGLKIPAHYVLNGTRYCRPCYQSRGQAKPAGENTAANTAARPASVLSTSDPNNPATNPFVKKESGMEKCRCGRELGHRGRHRGGLSPHKKSAADGAPAAQSFSVKHSGAYDWSGMLAQLEKERERVTEEFDRKIEEVDAAIKAIKVLVK